VLDDCDKTYQGNAIPSRRGGIADGSSVATACALQVGTVVEQLDDKTALVEFSDEQGRAYAVAPCPRSELLTLRYVPEAA
jgi:hypothetical protein